MKRALLIVMLMAGVAASAQTAAKLPVVKPNVATLRRFEDSLKVYSDNMINERYASQRFISDSMFTRTLVKALKTPYSFDYPFDSVQTVSHLYAPDSAFRIFTWQFWRDKDWFLQRGAIQMRTADGSLKLYPLHDVSMWTDAPQDSIRTPGNWIGAIYYNIIEKAFNGKKFYTLLGYDDHDSFTTRKWIDVLYFDDNRKPVFGGPFFRIVSDEVKIASNKMARFFIEYKDGTNAKLNYDKDMDMILYDHLISEDNHPERTATLVPDGDYVGFKWDGGKWVQIDKVFTYKLQDGQAPVPAPIKDAAGNNDESKLMQQSETNRKRDNEQRQKEKTKQGMPKKGPITQPPVVPDHKQPAKKDEESY